MPDKKKLILASASPRRHELLRGLFINFDIESANIDENIEISSPKKLVEQLAYRKAKFILDKHIDEDVIVLGADTVVVLDDKVLGKPADKKEAKQMLENLSSKEHSVLTGYALVDHKKKFVSSEKTLVRFDKIDKDLLDLYLSTGESMDKAGAYGIQGQALSFISNVSGSYANVVGLPVHSVLQDLKTFLGYKDDDKGIWRGHFS